MEDAKEREEHGFDSSDAAIERRLKRLIYACMFSGSRDGLRHVMDENRNLMDMLYKNPWIRSQFIWMDDVVTDNEIFFEGLIYALLPGFPTIREDLCLSYVGRWPGRNYDHKEVMWTDEWIQANAVQYRRDYSEYDNIELLKNIQNSHSMRDCYRRIMQCCVLFLDIRIDNNRKMLKEIMRYPPSMSIGCCMSWLETIDWFLVDIFQSLELEDFYKIHPKYNHSFQEWPGYDQSHFDGLLVKISNNYTVKVEDLNGFFRKSNFFDLNAGKLV